jgi:ABC-type oligopeptide transport system ATPase subunit
MGPSEDIYANPRDPYTRRLIEAVPDDDVESIKARRRERGLD